MVFTYEKCLFDKNDTVYFFFLETCDSEQIKIEEPFIGNVTKTISQSYDTLGVGAASSVFIKENSDVFDEIFHQRLATETMPVTVKPATVEKPFICDLCHKSFALMRYLKRHMLTHPGDGPLSCTLCNKRFEEESELEKHITSHVRQRKHACKSCGQVFTRKSTLDRHEFIHTGERPFACDECSESFSRKSALLQHKLCHRYGHLPQFIGLSEIFNSIYKYFLCLILYYTVAKSFYARFVV